MSNMNGNPHHKLAEHRLEGVHEWQSEEGSTDATSIATAIDAQTQATLALAYEQRTANHIAVQAMALTVLTSGSAIAGATTEADLQRMSTTIEERLGLNGDTK